MIKLTEVHFVCRAADSVPPVVRHRTVIMRNCHPLSVCKRRCPRAHVLPVRTSLSGQHPLWCWGIHAARPGNSCSSRACVGYFQIHWIGVGKDEDSLGFFFFSLIPLLWICLGFGNKACRVHCPWVSWLTTQHRSVYSMKH